MLQVVRGPHPSETQMTPFCGHLLGSLSRLPKDSISMLTIQAILIIAAEIDADKFGVNVGFCGRIVRRASTGRGKSHANWPVDLAGGDLFSLCSAYYSMH